jgi:hypothetical protein
VAVDQKNIGFPAVVAESNLGSVRQNTSCGEAYASIPKTAGLALSPYKPAFDIEHQVVALIHTKGQQDPVTALYEFTQDCCLGSKSNVDWVLADGWNRNRSCLHHEARL